VARSGPKRVAQGLPSVCGLDIWEGQVGIIYAPKVLQDSAQGFNRVSTLGTLKINEFALKGREVDQISLASVVAQKLE
jgi:hypothetical protein